jgi:hypothetical protein
MQFLFMKYDAHFINTRLEPGAGGYARLKPFQRFPTPEKPLAKEQTLCAAQAGAAPDRDAEEIEAFQSDSANKAASNRIGINL